MVIRDINRAEIQSHTFRDRRAPTRYAPPIERIAALFIDLLILGILSAIVFAPFQKQIQINRLTDNFNEYMFYLLFGLLAVLVLGVAYQAVSVFFWGTTPGKRAFGLYVVNFWTKEKPGIWDSTVRGLFWCLDLLLILPLLSLFADAHRRPIHDKVGDTVVVTKGRYFVGPPIPMEARIVKAMTLSCYALIFICVSVFLVHEKGNDSASTDPLNFSSENVCEDVTKAFESWPQNSSGKKNKEGRMSVALAMYAVGDIEDDCLNLEALEMFRRGAGQEEMTLGYLARAFVTSEEVKLSNSYLAQVCETDEKSEACQFSKLVDLWTEKKWSEATEGFQKILPNSSDFVKVWAVKHFEKTNEFDLEIDVIESMWPHRILSEFLVSHRVVALWNLHRVDEARATLVATLDRFDEEKSIGLASWSCIQELNEGCKKETPKACRIFEQTVQEAPGILDNGLIAIAQIRHNECELQESTNYSSLKRTIPNESARRLLTALESIKDGKIQKATRELEDLISDIDSDETVLFDARRRLVGVTSDPEKLDLLAEEWKTLDSQDWGWKLLGSALFEKLRKGDRLEKALEVGQILGESDPYDLSLRKKMVTTAFRGGKNDMAWEFLVDLRDRTKGTRTPANSVNGEEFDFKKAQQELDSKFGGP